LPEADGMTSLASLPFAGMLYSVIKKAAAADRPEIEELQTKDEALTQQKGFEGTLSERLVEVVEASSGEFRQRLL